MPYTWEEFTDYLDGTRPITTAERDELWDALAYLLDECGGTWQLVGEDMDAIKASRLVTDKTVVENTDTLSEEAGDLAAVLIAIEDTFTGDTGLDAFKAVADDEGLSEEQLAEFVTGAGRATQLETYHLWNLYKRVLTSLACCPEGAPTFQWDRRAASDSKWGYTFNGTDFFLAVSGSGTDTAVSWIERYFEDDDPPAWRWVTWNITISMSVSGGVDDETRTRVMDMSKVENSTSEWPDNAYSTSAIWTGCDWQNRWHGSVGGAFQNLFSSYLGNLGSVTPFGAPTCPPVISGDAGRAPGSLWGISPPVDFEITSPSTATATGSQLGGTEERPESINISHAITLSTPYTDELLESNVMAALAEMSFPGTWASTAGSYRNLAGGTLGLAEGKARIPLAGWALSVGKTYRAIFFRRFSPVGGGSAVDGEEEYIEFEFTEGMTHSPVIDDVEIPDVGDNGTNLLVGVRWECAPFDA